MNGWKKLLCISGVVVSTAVVSYGRTDYKFHFKHALCKSEQKHKPKVSDISGLDLHTAIIRAADLLKLYKEEIGAPGIVIAVSINGKIVWCSGVGYADVENRVPCHPETVMRIASISKSMTMAVVGRLWENNKLDLDKPIQDYVPQFPSKTFDGKPVTITTRMLVSHLSGIRHYKKKENAADKTKEDKEFINFQTAKDPNTPSDPNTPRDSHLKEFYIKEHFKGVNDSLMLFKDDELMFKPGTSFLYTTHGWTVISAVVESVTKEPFSKTMKDFFDEMGLKQTYLDEHTPIIYNRSRYYMKNSRGRIINAPYVDTSHKWAGGGFLSTVKDLLKFGNAMLYCYQQGDSSKQLGYLKQATVKEMWTPHPTSKHMKWGRGDGYGMGWVVVPYKNEHAMGDVQPFVVGHTGGAVGASSVLLLVPTEDDSIPSGIAVAILTNLQDVGLQTLALNIAELFSQVPPNQTQSRYY